MKRDRLIDWRGLPILFALIAGFGFAQAGSQWRLFNQHAVHPSGLQVAFGNYIDVETVHKFGRNIDVNQAAPEDVWGGGGDYTFPTAAETIDVVSTSAADTCCSGDGARTFTIEGLDANGDFLTETIDLTGQTPKETDGLFLRVNRAYVATAGDDGSNAGVITADNTTSSNVLITIIVGEGQTHLGIYTVANGRVLLMTRLYGSVGRQAASVATITLYRRPQGGAWRVRQVFGLNSQGSTIGFVMFTPPLAFSSMTDLRLQAGVTLTGDINAGFDGYLVTQ
jgi:hypothetical protein